MIELVLAVIGAIWTASLAIAVVACSIALAVRRMSRTHYILPPP